MYNQRVIGILMVLAATLIASISQILLKHSANADHKSRCAEYLNIFVVLGYGLLLATTVINVFALRRIPLSMAVALDASGQVFVPILSCLFLREHLNIRKMLGMAVIIIGICIFAM